MSDITMQMVADRAGVSIKTVSRVVNKESGVKKQTRDKVLEAVRALDYQPNPSARGLASARSYLIALLYDNPSPAYITGLQTGALEACRANGYGLIIHPCVHTEPDIGENIRLMARQNRLDGLLLTPPLCDMPEVLDLLDAHSLRYVRISPLSPDDRSPYVYADEFSAAYRMTEYLVSQGHHDIGFITGHPNRSGTERRLAGFRKALEDNLIDIDEDRIIEGFYTFSSGEAAARRLLRAANRPTAIFASNDYMAAGVMKVANQMKINVPYDLSIAGYDDSPMARHIWPPITTVRHPVNLLASEATKQLLLQIAGEPADFDPDSIQSELVIRESTGPARA